MRPMEYGCKCYHLAGRTAELVDAGCALHGPYRTRVNTTKYLTDTECAAELWREHALWTEAFMGRESPDPEVAAHYRSELPVVRDRSDTWHRFATQPHASEVEQ